MSTWRDWLLVKKPVGTEPPGPFFDFSIPNDIHISDFKYLEDKIESKGELTVSFLILLIGASIVCTLGLLSNATAIVIGGMIISPIMWPLMKVAFGIVHENGKFIRHALFLLIFSVVVGLFGSVVITLLSPLKSLNAEILARTNPNIIDIIVALVAGFVAALGIAKPKISDSLAGVAIATSLMPPLCVAGIGLALLEPRVMLSGFYLFAENVIAIIFAGTLVFTILTHQHASSPIIRRRGARILITLLVVISLPSLYLLYRQASEIKTYNKVQTILSESLENISASIKLDSSKISFTTKDGLDVSANILVPEGVSISYLDQEKISQKLNQETGRNISLSVNIQRILPVLNQDQLSAQNYADTARKRFSTLIKHIDTSLEIASFEVTANNGQLKLQTTLRGDADVVFTETERELIQQTLTNELDRAVSLNIEIIEKRSLLASSDVTELAIKKKVFEIAQTNLKHTEVRNVSLKTMSNENSSSAPRYIVSLDLRSSINAPVEREALQLVKKQIELEYPYRFIFEATITENRRLTF